MIVVTARMEVPEEHVTSFVDAVRTVVAATTSSESGCSLYECGRDVLEPSRFFFVEQWDDMAAIGAHVDTPHLKDFQDATASYVRNQVVTIHDVSRSRAI